MFLELVVEQLKGNLHVQILYAIQKFTKAHLMCYFQEQSST